MKISSQYFTPRFRSLLRDNNPTWTDRDCMAWTWKDGPIFEGKPIPTSDLDSRQPGAESIGIMFHEIKTGSAALTFGCKFHRR